LLLKQIEVEVAELKNNLKRTESDAASKEEQARAELDALRGELAKCRRDKDTALGKLREQEQATEASKRKLTQAHQDSLSKIQGLESSLREAHSKLASAESKLASSRESYREAQDALAASKAANARLEQRHAEHQSEVEALKRDFARQVESIAPSYREQSEKYVKRMTLALNKEKKRAEAYKTKALEAHSKVKTLSETLIREGDAL
jgi:chromosome segregation ATPase